MKSKKMCQLMFYMTLMMYYYYSAEATATNCTNLTSCDNNEVDCNGRGNATSTIQLCVCSCNAPYLPPDCSFTVADATNVQVVVSGGPTSFSSFVPTTFANALASNLQVASNAVYPVGASPTASPNTYNVTLSLRSTAAGARDVVQALQAAISGGTTWTKTLGMQSVASVDPLDTPAYNVTVVVVVNHNYPTCSVSLAPIGWALIGVVLIVMGVAEWLLRVRGVGDKAIQFAERV